MPIFKVGDLVRFKVEFIDEHVFTKGMGIILKMSDHRAPRWYGTTVLVDGKKIECGTGHIEVITDDSRAT